MKTADYSWCGGPVVEYDETAPCWMCGLPVLDASMGGTVICGWCDCGRHRDGTPWTLADSMRAGERYIAARRQAQEAEAR